MHVHLESQEGYGLNSKLFWSNNWPWIGFHLTKQHSSNNLSSPPHLQSSLPGAPLTWLANSRPLRCKGNTSMFFWLSPLSPFLGFSLKLHPPLSLIQTSTASGKRQYCLCRGQGTLVALANLTRPLLLVQGSQSTSTH